MTKDDFLPFEEQFAALKAVVVESNRRVVEDPVDELFFSSLNVFIKSYVVSACSILEAYLQEIATRHFRDICNRINEANIPHNLMVWNAFGESKPKEYEFRKFSVSVSESQLRESLSGNFEKTVKAFRWVGVDLLQSDDFKRTKDFVAAFVDKRNKIVHHNDLASDLSLMDVAAAIEILIEYVRTVSAIVVTDPLSAKTLQTN